MDSQCENCKEIDKRVQKWIDHIGCSPRKSQRYDGLLKFVKMVAENKYSDYAASYISRMAQELLELIGEDYDIT